MVVVGVCRRNKLLSLEETGSVMRFVGGGIIGTDCSDVERCRDARVEYC
jgi:hypothetical protein